MQYDTSNNMKYVKIANQVLLLVNLYQDDLHVLFNDLRTVSILTIIYYHLQEAASTFGYVLTKRKN